KNGITLVTINMNGGGTQTFSMTIANGKITGLAKGGSACQQKMTISENDFTTALTSTDFASALGYLYGQKAYRVSGCSFFSGFKLFFVNIFAPGQVANTAPPPTPKPAPNCGNIGEQCNNRGCFSGMCGAPEERSSGGQWGHWNYRCIDQATYTANCLGRGNTPPAWACLAGPCR
ncbi:hypothetical protein GOV10_04770, partial [Candidatus Woesearchaeota archaeon]|nr:hypothetical protein [Candidatus Woesearchaeota archaeon]